MSVKDKFACKRWDVSIPASFLSDKPLALPQMMSSNNKARTLRPRSTIAETTISGIVTTTANERIIPATRRADGSLRPERRVREGFVPLEDVQRYKNARVAAAELQEVKMKKSVEPQVVKTRAQKKNEKRKAKREEKREKDLIECSNSESENESALGGDNKITLNDEAIPTLLPSEQELGAPTASKEELESEKSHQTRLENDILIRSLEKMSIQSSKSEKASLSPKSPKNPTSTVSPSNVITISQSEATKKRMKALEKKIRQVEQLVERQDAGDTALNAEQLEKIIRLPEFQEELKLYKKGEIYSLME
ncbi:hypothetical protein G9A89_008789 [Geosiphon pyriformis]|nr:hypothetical protein G9A89_008789 [Geosiphon pyriformis]